ncbi:ABC transporter [Paenibacillus ehimensis]|uniref:ABC transporter n=1 Tax=Paenibacillus ehimensis TaxID=79264 RepID=UPI000FDAD905|nr:ABC transporter [Paenibacillus ehimensis]
MNMILEEVIESINKKRLVSVLIFFQVLILFFILTVIFLNYNQIDSKSKKAEYLENFSAYKLSDTIFDSDELKKLMKQPDFLTKIKIFYGNLENSLDEKYIYIFNQSVALLNFGEDNKRKFTYGYESGVATKGSFYEKQDGPYYSIKALQMNKQAFDHFGIDVIEGEPLSSQDFENKNNNDNVPVLLGSEYRGLYKVGDTLKGRYLFKKFTFSVKGFVDKSTMVFNSNNRELYLDRYIIMPAQQFNGAPSNKEEFSFQQKHYLQLINGEIFSSENEYMVRNKLEQVKDRSQFYDIQLLGANSLPLNLIFSAIQENVWLLGLVATSIFFVCIISISMIMVAKLNENVKNLSIHLISGATLNHIFSYFLAEIACMVAVPGLVSAFLYKVIIDVNMGSYLIFLLFSMCTIFLLCVVPFHFKFKQLQISMFLKRTE